MKTQDQTSQASITPATAQQMLVEGNERFQKRQMVQRDYLRQVEDTRGGQWPFAVVLSCIDSRVPAEIVFDQGVGDIFSARVAGNFVNHDILGSIEYGCKVAGAKLVVVLGHTHCGAVKGACDDVKLGHITGLLDKLKPAVSAVTEPADPAQRNSKNNEFVSAVVEKNVDLTLENIVEQSAVLRDMQSAGEIAIIGAVYDVESGAVRFSD